MISSCLDARLHSSSVSYFMALFLRNDRRLLLGAVPLLLSRKAKEKGIDNKFQVKEANGAGNA
jgi:hypothetical protein